MDIKENESNINSILSRLKIKLDNLSNSINELGEKIPKVVIDYCDDTPPDLSKLEDEIKYVIEMFSSLNGMMVDNSAYLLHLEEKILLLEKKSMSSL